MLIGLNILYGVYRYYYEYEQKKQEQKKIVSTAIFFTLLCGLILAVFSFPLSRRLSQSLFNSDDFRGYLQLAFLGVIPVSVYNYTLGLLRLKRQALAYILSALIVSLIYLATIVLFIGLLQFGINGFYYAQILTYSLGVLITLFRSRDLLTISISFGWFKQLAKYGFPLVPSTLLIWGLAANTRLYLNAFTETAQVGYYAFANKVSILVTLTTQAFCSAWEPTMYSLLAKEEQLRKKLPDILSIYTLLALIVSLFVLVISKEAYLLLAPPEYLFAIGLVGIIGLRWLFTMGVCIIDPGTAKTKKTYLVSLSLAIAMAVNIAANKVLLPLLGIWGAAFAELTGYALAMILRWVISNRLFPIQWGYKFFLGSLTLYAFIAFAVYQVIRLDLPFLLSLSARLILFAAFILAEIKIMDKSSKAELDQTFKSGLEKFRLLIKK